MQVNKLHPVDRARAGKVKCVNNFKDFLMKVEHGLHQTNIPTVSQKTNKTEKGFMFRAYLTAITNSRKRADGKERRMYLGFPRSAAWWRALKPLLLVMVTSAPASSRTDSMSSLFLLMASWRGVSPSESYREHRAPYNCSAENLYTNQKAGKSAPDPALARFTWRLGWQPKSNSVFTTCKWPLLTAMCNGVCLRLFLALRSAPPRCRTSITEPSSPNAAWCTARSPSLSFITKENSTINKWSTGWTSFPLVNTFLHYPQCSSTRR